MIPQTPAIIDAGTGSPTVAANRSRITAMGAIAASRTTSFATSVASQPLTLADWLNWPNLTVAEYQLKKTLINRRPAAINPTSVPRGISGIPCDGPEPDGGGGG